MDASCAISVLSALLRRLQFNAVVCACRAIWKGETALQEMLPARQTIAKSPCRGVFNANPGFEYRSNFFPLFLFFFSFSFITRQFRYLRHWETIEHYLCARMNYMGKLPWENLTLLYFSIKTHSFTLIYFLIIHLFFYNDLIKWSIYNVYFHIYEMYAQWIINHL